MLISGNEPSSMILIQTKEFKKWKVMLKKGPDTFCITNVNVKVIMIHGAIDDGLY